MHREACSAPGSKAAKENAAARRKPEPWSAQWVGRLSMDEMEAAVQEVPHCCSWAALHTDLTYIVLPFFRELVFDAI